MEIPNIPNIPNSKKHMEWFKRVYEDPCLWPEIPIHNNPFLTFKLCALVSISLYPCNENEKPSFEDLYIHCPPFILEDIKNRCKSLSWIMRGNVHLWREHLNEALYYINKVVHFYAQCNNWNFDEIGRE
jgi:hypothetical protein